MKRPLVVPLCEEHAPDGERYQSYEVIVCSMCGKKKMGYTVLSETEE